MSRQCEQALKRQLIQHNNIMSRKYSKPLEGFQDLLFTTKFGTPICDQIMIDAIKKIVNEINLCKDELEQFEMFTPHCFRHTFATRCFEAGIQPKTVQNYLGHATLQMTMDLYTTVLENHNSSFTSISISSITSLSAITCNTNVFSAAFSLSAHNVSMFAPYSLYGVL